MVIKLGDKNMKNKLIIGSIIAIFLLMMFPSISALEYKAVEKAQEEEFLKLLGDNDLDPKQQGMVRKIFWLILKIITFPMRMIKKFLKIIFRIVTLPARIFWKIIDILTPFRDFHRCRFKFHCKFHHKK